MIPRWAEVVELLKKGLTLEAQQKIVELQAAFVAQKEEHVQLTKHVFALREGWLDVRR
jgi:hypothetical protein